MLDHGSTDGSTEVGGFVRIPVEHETVDNTWMLDMVETHQRRLLDRYDVVVLADVDEMIAPDPGLGHARGRRGRLQGGVRQLPWL